MGRELQSWFQVLTKRKLAWPQVHAPPTPLYLPAFLYPQGLSLGLKRNLPSCGTGLEGPRK